MVSTMGYWYGIGIQWVYVMSIGYKYSEISKGKKISKTGIDGTAIPNIMITDNTYDLII